MIFFEGKNKFVKDGIGLGRYPSQWWTMNCKYNAAYDVQRLNVCSQLGNMSVEEAFPGDKQERFEFVRDSCLCIYFIEVRDSRTGYLVPGRDGPGA